MEDDNSYNGTKDRGGNQPTDPYDRQHWMLRGIPGVLSTKPSVVHITPDEVRGVETFTVQTFRQKDVKDDGKTVTWDTVFLKHVDKEITRLVLPDAVVKAIIRQHEALTAKSRSLTAKEKARERKEQGLVPFQKKA